MENNNLLFKNELDCYGFSYESTEDITGIWVKFEISHTDPRWNSISEILKRHKVVAKTFTEFSKEELLGFDYLKIEPDGHFGFPQPENHFEYLRITYDGTGCKDCRMGYSQQGSFQMKDNPKWGRRGIIQLNWIFDEYFVRPEIWREIFKPFGINSRPVLKYKKEAVLETVVQLDIQNIAFSSIRSNTLSGNPCYVCGRSRYFVPRYGPYPTFNVSQSLNFFKTQEYFGDGGATHRWIVVSQEMYRYIVKKQLRGIHFIPMVDDPEEYIRTHLE